MGAFRAATVLVVTLLVAGSFAGCARDDGDAPTTTAGLVPGFGTFEPAGWAPGWPSPELAVLGSGFAVATSWAANGSAGETPAALWVSDGTGAAEKVKEFPNMFIASASLGDTLFLFRSPSPAQQGGMQITRYHMPTGQFKDDARLPDDRLRSTVTNSASAIAIGSRIYLVGGCCEDASFYVYDPQTLVLTRLGEVPALPEERTILNNPPLATDGRHLFVGVVASNPPGVLAYDTETGEWRTGAGPWAHAYAYADGYLWGFGGWCLFRWDPVTLESGARWRFQNRIEQLPTALSATVNDGAVYILAKPLDGPPAIYRWTPPTEAEWPGGYESRCTLDGGVD